MATTTPLLEVRGLHAYYGKSHILHGVDLHVGEGEIVALLGRNGVGRSTLAKSIMGMVRCEGHILLRGQDVRGLRTFEVAHRGIGYVPENRDIFPTLTVRQNLLLGEKRNPRQPRPRWRLDDMYRLFPRLKEREHTPAGVLSGGEQQMLTLCRTLMGDPDFVIIDEPTEGLAPLIVAQVGDYLKMLKARGVSVLLVEQKLAIALDISQRVYVMGHGQIVFEGTPADLKADAQVRREWLEV
ncbi:ABC transporter ATP-binding protein [Ralstonia solanacearum]|uniref:ABC transporter ATP-binding protein n=1 Tax=Ralstonia solanacearum TaxID=305 RepID=UPI0005C5A532|nr:ABC transporter ATP-binding protein [Ralstonia solanacearum]MBB6591264.1 ABC transporter ATP-binding protein [Ralstonia solanacearum]MBB6595457.1 ABC transporter ATP-binding protein [Ralstonia solanacearum]MDB0542504.1 ABC transporter ATP-binding protein [Ralstonia solanacearum]MDB0551788.1 ABC transporter ATP-binding protein [Ralstonia solanacearum]MDB0556537.1 ABC transporter ATP-binding protein [Ralstonia solanacearum]